MSITHMEKRRSHIWHMLFLCAATFVVYGRIVGHEFIFNWDDFWYVTNNDAVQEISWKNVRTIFSSYYVGNYAPVQMLSYMFDYSIWGLKAGGFLFTNIFIHALNGMLLYHLLLKLHSDKLLATIGAGVFLLHPVQVESVAWVSQRKTLLAMLFFLLAWEGYLRYREADPGKGWSVYLLSLVFFVLSLLSKSVAVVFPVVIVAYDYCFSQGNRRLRLVDKIPYIAAAGCAATLALHSQLPGSNIGGGRVAVLHGGNLLATFFTMLPVFCRYLVELVFPVELSVYYDTPLHQHIDAPVVVATLLLAGVTFLCLRLCRFDLKLGFWPIVFFIGLVPVSQIVPLVTLMNDRYLYFPMLGVAALSGAGAMQLRDRYQRRFVGGLYFLFALLLFLLAAGSLQRAAVWRNPVTLWSDAVEKNSDVATLWEYLGEAYHNSNPPLTAKAMDAYRHALALYPASELTLLNLGVLYIENGEYDKAYELVVKLLEVNPDHVMGWTALGNVYMQRKDYPAAEQAYSHALALQPDAMQVVALLGKLALEQGKLDAARNYFLQVENTVTGDPFNTLQLACVESLAGHRAEALSWLETSLQRGYRDYQALNNERGLAPLKEDPGFSRLLRRYFPDTQLK